METATIGLILAIATAVTVVLKDKTLDSMKGSSMPHMANTFGIFVVSIPIQLLFVAAYFYFYPETLKLESNFFFTLLINSPLLVLANYYYVKAYRGNDLFSAISPLTALTPMGTLITAYVFVQQVPTIWGIIAIGLTGFGFFLLGLCRISPGIKWNFWTPFLMLYSTKEARYILVTSVAWMFTSATDAMGIEAVIANGAVIRAMAWSISKTILASIIMLIICRYVGQRTMSSKVVFDKKVMMTGFFHALEHTFQMTGVALWNVVYMVAIKRTSIFIAVIVGIVFNKERDRLALKILGALIVVIGVVVIKLLG